MSNVGLFIWLWGVVLLGNIFGIGIVVWVFEYMFIFNEEICDVFVKIGMDVMKNIFSEMFVNVIIFGWLIVIMVWMFFVVGVVKIVVIILMIWFIVLGDIIYIVVGFVEIFYLVFNGMLYWSDFIWFFVLFILVGNICGGIFIFVLMSYVQICNDMSNKCKVEVC